MSEVFEAKVRKVGNSLGIIIPRELAMEAGFSEGDMIHVAIPNADAITNIRKLRALAGTMKGAKPFIRDKRDRF